MYEDVCMDTAIVHIATLIVASAAQEERGGHLGGGWPIQRLDPAKNSDNRLNVMGEIP